MTYSNYLSVPLMAVLVVIQATLLTKIPLFGIVPQLLFLVAVAWALTQGLNDGLIWAVVAGFFIDLFSITPLGVSSLSAIAGVAAATLAYRSFPDSRLIMPAVVTALGTVVFWFVALLLTRLVVPLWIGGLDSLGIGQLVEGTQTPGLMESISREYGLRGPVVALILETAVLHALLMVPLIWGVRAARRWTTPRQIEI
jgi:rod shape-determining protein MreD